MCEVRIQPLLIWCHPREALLPSKLAREVLQLPAQALAAVRKVPTQHTRQDILQLLTQLCLARPDHLRLSLHHLLHLGGLQAANHLVEPLCLVGNLCLHWNKFNFIIWNNSCLSSFRDGVLLKQFYLSFPKFVSENIRWLTRCVEDGEDIDVVDRLHGSVHIESSTTNNNIIRKLVTRQSTTSDSRVKRPLR